jgi:hypothetical protein
MNTEKKVCIVHGFWYESWMMNIEVLFL